LIDDDTPTPAHARFSAAQRLAQVAVVGAVLWLVPAWRVLVAAWGWHGHCWPRWAGSSPRPRCMTFGGAYAVLPYVYQGAVEQFQWLTGPQMIDGLALGETTPGPLIMVVAFVGFVGGWAKQVLGPDMLFLGAALAATVVTGLHLPAVLPVHPGRWPAGRVHAGAGWASRRALTAITAAVVGVIVSLALFFIAHVGWPGGTARADLVALALTALAAVALFRFKAGVIPVIAGCAILGAASRYLV
jgi:chromate transporter